MRDASEYTFGFFDEHWKLSCDGERETLRGLTLRVRMSSGGIRGRAYEILMAW
ncbi:hypothetical protein [Rhodococcus sp. 15-649-2-2]|uniref:hypothetical protein n=1 Tax=Rhodococcus sp. 15-649-2-2 TaxID=2023140 RepID=UPI0015C6937D|nr:hypothetical protein [Rhodococcus sp. 15-649-2-2]